MHHIPKLHWLIRDLFIFSLVWNWSRALSYLIHAFCRVLTLVIRERCRNEIVRIELSKCIGLQLLNIVCSLYSQRRVKTARLRSCLGWQNYTGRQIFKKVGLGLSQSTFLVQLDILIRQKRTRCHQTPFLGSGILTRTQLLPTWPCILAEVEFPLSSASLTHVVSVTTENITLPKTRFLGYIFVAHSMDLASTTVK